MFWPDSLSRKSYAIFSDILSFDMTHKTHGYSMVFVPFIGHHRQLIYFGVSLLRMRRWSPSSSCSTASSLRRATTCRKPWLRTKIWWLDSNSPVFETSIHQFCMWHIMRKLPEKVSRMLNGCKDFIECIKGCVWASNSPNKFEESQGEMLEEFNLTYNECLCHTYEIRELWVHVSFKRTFGGYIEDSVRF